MKLTHRLILPVAALVASATIVTAQQPNNQQPPPAGGERREGDRGGRGFSMEDFRKRMEERLKGSLKVSDEEWAVLQPLIEKVQTKQRDAMGSSLRRLDPADPAGLQGAPEVSVIAAADPTAAAHPAAALLTVAANAGAAPMAAVIVDPAAPVAIVAARPRVRPSARRSKTKTLRPTKSKPSSPPCAKCGRKPPRNSPPPARNCRKS